MRHFHMGTSHWPRQICDITKEEEPVPRARLTAVAAAEHGQCLERHLVEEQSHGFVVQVVLQQEAVIVHVPPLTRDRHALTHTRASITISNT